MSSHRPIRTPGQTFVRGLVNELMRSSAWASSAFLISFDDSGGAYDHVAPPAASADGVAYGVRVPALLISPYARSGSIDNTTLDATSALAFIRRNWRIEPLAVRDRSAASFLNAFEFSRSPGRPTYVPAVQAAAVTPTSVKAVYPLYGIALLIPLALVGVMTWRTRSRKEQR